MGGRVLGLMHATAGIHGGSEKCEGLRGDVSMQL